MSRHHITNKLKRADAEIRAGRPWRAKEILQGSLSHPSYVLDPEFLEAYGVLLDSLGDRFEAGKYLFLSGHRQPSYHEPIELFWHHTRHTNIKSILKLFPREIHRSGMGNLPQIVRDELQSRGAAHDTFTRCEPRASQKTDPRNANLIFGGIITILLGIAFSSFVGTVTIIRWFF